jgi:hypothetical protein
MKFSIFKNFFELYIPFVYSKDIKNALNANNKGGFFDTMRFTLNLHNINPKKIIETNFFIFMIIKLLLFFILTLTNIYNFRNSTLKLLLIYFLIDLITFSVL